MTLPVVVHYRAMASAENNDYLLYNILARFTTDAILRLDAGECIMEDYTRHCERDAKRLLTHLIHSQRFEKRSVKCAAEEIYMALADVDEPYYLLDVDDEYFNNYSEAYSRSRLLSFAEAMELLNVKAVNIAVVNGNDNVIVQEIRNEE